jgi:hypothetical protein
MLIQDDVSVVEQGGPTINFHRDDLKRKAMLYGHTLTYLGTPTQPCCGIFVS